MIGTTLSHYRVTDKLGAGGMGIVYRAHDERLDRDVAIKVLPEEVARDEERLARFEREAKLLASLSHQNIKSCQVSQPHTPTTQTYPPDRPHRAEGLSNRPKTSSSATRPAHAACRQSVRVVTRSCYKLGKTPHRILIHISRSEHRVLEPTCSPVYEPEASDRFLGSPRPKP